MDILVVAKAPVAGRVKTRLCPPCSPAEAAEVAEAALAATFAACTGAGADRVVVALEGRPGPWAPPGVVIVDQGCGPLDRRLARAWGHVQGPTLQIGMDTPQVTGELLRRCLTRLADPGVDAVLGMAADGGWWGLGMGTPEARLFLGVPTSRPDTGSCQLDRLRESGRRTALLPVLRDVDTFPDALAVAAAMPGTRFGRVVDAICRRVA